MREWWIHEYEGERGGLQDRIQPFKKLPLSWLFWNVDILLHVAVFRSKAIFSNICMPCDIKHRLQTRETDLFLVLLVVVRGDFSFSQAWEGGGHMKQGRRPAKVWISNVCPQFYPDLRCEKLILNFEIFHTVFRAKRSIINMNERNPFCLTCLKLQNKLASLVDAIDISKIFKLFCDTFPIC